MATRELDYRKVGLRCGLEIHQQLDTAKLFCSCPSVMVDDKQAPEFVFSRRLLAVEGESGEVDRAAAEEQRKQKRSVYNFYREACCLVEMDEEPPHPMDTDALAVVLQVARMLGATVVDQVQVMRKTVIDGSNTSGFQRTALVATGGSLDGVSIQTVCIEEDSAKIVERESTQNTYNLSRLGIPLIEIATGPDIVTASGAKEVAERIGMVLRSTGKVKRGLGTIRQDLNVSIKGGVRVEIKGVQDLRMIPSIVDNEILRQQNLLGIHRTIMERKLSPDHAIIDVSSAFRSTSSKVVAAALGKADGRVLAIRLPGYRGLLGKAVQEGRRYGSELSDHAKTRGVHGMFHTDELPAYGITADEVAAVERMLKAGNDDAFVLIADERMRAEDALREVIAHAARTSLEKEVRNANPDGSSSYLRPMPGAARM